MSDVVSFLLKDPVARCCMTGEEGTCVALTCKMGVAMKVR